MKRHLHRKLIYAALIAGSITGLSLGSIHAQDTNIQGPNQPQFPGSGNSFGAPPQKFWKGPRWEKLQGPLGLTDDQMEELKNIRSEHRQAVQKIKQDQTLTREQKKEKLSQLRQQMKKEFENVLTSEQIQKLNQMRQQWREKCKKNECPLTPSDPLSNGQSVNKPATN